MELDGQTVEALVEDREGAVWAGGVRIPAGKLCAVQRDTTQCFAFQHAQAKRIEVQIAYDPRQFRLQIVDDGKGIDPAVLNAGARAGHHGLPGIKERAELAGGKLSVWSQLDSGTEIELTIPASLAYLKSRPPGPHDVRETRS
jgi:hypothetical protein